MKFKLIFCLLLLPLFVSCQQGAKAIEVSFVLPNGTRTPTVSAEVVETYAKRAQGLMYRKELSPDRGMLFVFSGDAPRSFWMKNTYLELDMIFINREGEVVTVLERAEPLTETPRPSAEPAMFVLEVLGGSAAQWGLHAGAQAEFVGELPDGE